MIQRIRFLTLADAHPLRYMHLVDPRRTPVHLEFIKDFFYYQLRSASISVIPYLFTWVWRHRDT